MSDLGSLSECLVDNDPAVRVRARRLRSKALVFSVALEAAIFAALILWPLFSPGVLTAQYIVTPAPPYSGGGGAKNITRDPRAPTGITSPLICLAVCAPALRPSAPEKVRSRRTLGRNRAAEAKDRACQARGQVFPVAWAIALLFPNRRTRSRLTFDQCG